MILLVTGDRNWVDEIFIVNVIKRIHEQKVITLLVNGKCHRWRIK